MLSKVGVQLGALSASQRIAIGLCAALVATSLLWLMQWSVAPDLVPLTNYEFSYEELTEARQVLAGESGAYKIVGKKIYVTPADRDRLLLKLSSADALPEGSLMSLEELVNNTDPFMSPEQLQLKENYARGNTLAQMMMAYPFVQSAQVIINPKRVRRLGAQQSDVPTASVSVMLKPGTEMERPLVETFAKIVSGAVPGLKPYNVNVTDARTGRTFNVPHPDEAGRADLYEMERKRESDLKGKIQDALAIPGLLLAVSVELDPAISSKTIYRHDKPQPRTERTSADEMKSTEGGPAESGVQANVGSAITASAGGQSSTKEENNTEYFPGNLREEERIQNGTWSIQRVTASVSIPRSYVMGLVMARTGSTAEPKEEELQADRDAQIARVKSAVQKIINARDPEDVMVDVYPDMMWKQDGPSWMQAPGSVVTAGAADPGGTLAMVRGYGPQIGLGVLAVTSLFMMLRIVRKSATVGALRTTNGEQDDADDEDSMHLGPQTIGEATLNDGFLTGQEVDEKTIMERQLAQEVSKMVAEDPKAAAELVQRWVNEQT
jgi:flagellar biosynthesis/type III secretory pathway M-ring protein FliF/YscJ